MKFHNFLLLAFGFLMVAGCGKNSEMKAGGDSPAIPAKQISVAPAPRPKEEKTGSGMATKDKKDKDDDLLIEDLGIDLKAVLPELERVEKQTVDAVVLPDNPGNAQNNSQQNAVAPPEAGKQEEKDDLKSGIYRFRFGEAKTKLLGEGGGNQVSERAVALGLAWLARQQKQDGSWVYDAGYKDEVIAATGMGLLPFLAAGFTHKNSSRYQKTVQEGLSFLVKNCPMGPNEGKLSANMYAQAIGTLALCEAYGMTKDKDLLKSAQAAVNYIQKAQGPNGSWGYASGASGDTSIVGWQIQALQAARLSKDINVSDAVIKRAVAFLDLTAAGSRKAVYGYADNTGAAPGTSLTSVGLLCRYYMDKWGPDNAGLAEGVLGLMKRAPGAAPAKPALDVYFYYYATQVVHYFEGDEWKNWNEGPKQADGSRKGGMRDWLIDLQFKKPGANEGSWEPDPGFIGRSCGRLGTTSLCLLTLEVYYRHLPLYERGNNDVGK